MKAMILAAGRGERMRPLTDHTPKPLLKAGGKALIVWHIERLNAAGFKTIVINHAYLGAQIEAYLGNGARWGVSIEYSAELCALETAGGIANASKLLGRSPFLVVNGDVYTDYDFAKCRDKIISMHDCAAPLAHLVMVDNPPQHPLGDFSVSATRVLSKTTVDLSQSKTNDALQAQLLLAEGSEKLTFSGIGIYQPQLFAHIAQGSAAKLAPILREAMHNQQVTGEHFKGQWFDIGTPERLQLLDAMLNHNQIEAISKLNQ